LKRLILFYLQLIGEIITVNNCSSVFNASWLDWIAFEGYCTLHVARSETLTPSSLSWQINGLSM